MTAADVENRPAGEFPKEEEVSAKEHATRTFQSH